MQPLIVRADADTQIGTGHVMRCLALAQSWLDAGGQVTFAAATLPPALGERLASENIATTMVTVESGSPDDARRTADLARAAGAGWVIVDGYQFGADYQRVLKDAGMRVLFVDDYGHAGSYCADLVLNQNSYAREEMYPDRARTTRLLLGARYALLRREFRSWPIRRREILARAYKVLVTMGGSDPANFTLRVLAVLDLLDVPGLEVNVVVGGGNPHYEELRVVAERSCHRVGIECNVIDIPRLMSWADIAVSAGGFSCYELAFMGLPALFVVLAENQRLGADALDKAGTGWNLGWHSKLETRTLAVALDRLLTGADTRANMSLRGRALIDGHGSARVAAYLRGEPLSLRRAVDEDCRLLWEWSNEPGVRSASFSTEPIPWERHSVWFAARVGSPDHRIFIGADAGGVAVGQVRFDLVGDIAVISVSLDRNARGSGYGSLLIRLGAAAIFAEGRTARIDAYVKPENQASLRAFERAGFAHMGPATVHGTQALRLALHREESTS